MCQHRHCGHPMLHKWSSLEPTLIWHDELSVSRLLPSGTLCLLNFNCATALLHSNASLKAHSIYLSLVTPHHHQHLCIFKPHSTSLHHQQNNILMLSVKISTKSFMNIMNRSGPKINPFLMVRVRTIPSSAPNTQYPILWLLTILIPNTNTDTGSDVIRSNKNTLVLLASIK